MAFVTLCLSHGVSLDFMAGRAFNKKCEWGVIAKSTGQLVKGLCTLIAKAENWWSGAFYGWVRKCASDPGQSWIFKRSDRLKTWMITMVCIERTAMYLLANKKNLLYTLLFIYLFLSSFSVSGSVTPRPYILDDSWAVALEYSLRHNLQFGLDIVFSYGPLGFLNAPASQGYFGTIRVLFSVLWSILVASSAILFFARLHGPPRFLFLLWVILFPYGEFLDPYIYLVMSAGVFLILGNEGQRMWPGIVICFIFAPLAMIKFTFFLAASSAVVVCCISKLLEKKFQSALIIIAAFAAAFVGFWTLSGQEIAHILLWIQNSIEISNGYSRAMAIVPSLATLRLVMAMLVIDAVLACYTLYKSDRNVSSISYIIITLLFVFLAWKHGFVRADNEHITTFLSSFPLLAGIVIATPRKSPVGTGIFPSIAFSIIIVLSFLVARYENNSGSIPQSLLRTHYQKIVSAANRIKVMLSGDMGTFFPNETAVKSAPYFSLPTLSRLTERYPVDVMNCTQIFALANEMNFLPRPVIQGYSAYTPYLQQLNGDFIRKQKEPSFVLYHQQTIDDRFPTLDDSAAFNAILRNYLPVAREGDYLLMAKNGSEPLALAPVHEQILKFGETLDFSGWNNEPIFVSIHMTRTLAGRGTTLLFQEFPLFIIVQTDNGLQRYRYVPIMGELPFLLSPLVEDNDDLLDIYDNSYRKKVNRISFMIPSGFPNQYEDSFAVKVFRVVNSAQTRRSAIHREQLVGMK